MVYSDIENSSDVEILSEPEDLFSDEPEKKDDDEKSDVKEQDEKKPAEEAKVRRKSRRIVKNPRKPITFDTLSSSNGLSALRKHFEGFHFKGKGHEVEDVSKVLTILQLWMSYQLCPSQGFESCMSQLEALGKKKSVQTLMKKYRTGIADWGEIQSDINDNEDELEEITPFDAYLEQLIANAPSDGEISEEEMAAVELKDDIWAEMTAVRPEQLERIARNRKLAEERRLKRMKTVNNSEQCGQPSGLINSSEEVTIEDNN